MACSDPFHFCDGFAKVNKGEVHSMTTGEKLRWCSNIIVYSIMVYIQSIAPNKKTDCLVSNQVRNLLPRPNLTNLRNYCQLDQSIN
jgi:hypothetical protein